MAGSLALVGSGEYLPEMVELESLLLQDGITKGKKPRFVQIPTAAGREGKDRLRYWEELGNRQAERLGVESVFVPVFDQNDAQNKEYADLLEDAALIYLSGGSPSHLAESLRDTVVGQVLYENWQAGTSVAGCSAGAMALCSKVVGLRGMSESVYGLGFISNLQVLPHFDRYFRFIPELAIKKLVRDTQESSLVGIDEMTALMRREGEAWQVHGSSFVHMLGHESTKYSHKEFITF